MWIDVALSLDEEELDNNITIHDVDSLMLTV